MCEFEMPALMFALIGIGSVGVLVLALVGMIVAVYAS